MHHGWFDERFGCTMAVPLWRVSARRDAPSSDSRARTYDRRRFRTATGAGREQSTTVSAVMLTMRRTVADGVRMCTGLATPSRIGPSVTPPPAAAFSRLNAMFAASSVGMISRFASPFSRELGMTVLRTSSDSAASPCISPSTSRSGSMRADQRERRAASSSPTAASLMPKLECDSSATLGVMPKRRISSAASSVISAICSARRDRD